MLDARDRFLEAGHYAPIRTALAGAICDYGVRDADTGALRLVDAGCGTGFYLEGVLDAVDDGVRALAADVSPAAVRRALRRTAGRADGVVADTWSPLPIRSGKAGALFTVFAPRNIPEFHRVLAPRGVLVVILPTAFHLRELRGEGHEGEALEIPPEKTARLLSSTRGLFGHQETVKIEYSVELKDSEARWLVGMGPAGHHRTPGQLAAITGGAATISVEAVSFTRC